MSRKKQVQKKESEPKKSRHIRYMLYPDNPQHVEAMERIRADNFPYIGIKHHIVDLDGNEILEESGKPHFHIYQEFENPVHPSACAKRYGLFDDSGKVSVQFCRCVTRTWAEALIYLTHLNAPEKELYNDSDLFGWSILLRKYQECALAYTAKNVDIRTALYAMLDWVKCDMAGKVITAEDTIKFLISSPYIRFRNERLFLDAIQEHNKVIWAREARDRIESYASGQIQLNIRSSGSDLLSIDDLRY